MLVPLDESDRELIHQIRKDAEDWLEERNIDQYRRGVDPAVVRRNIDRQIDAHQFFGWQVDGRVVAVVALTEPDDLWTDAERAEPQTYIGRLLVASDQHGHSHGAAVVEAVAAEARDHGDKWLRLNCWSTNTKLHAYYESIGFRHVRTVDVPGRMSGALFERELIAQPSGHGTSSFMT